MELVVEVRHNGFGIHMSKEEAIEYCEEHKNAWFGEEFWVSYESKWTYWR